MAEPLYDSLTKMMAADLTYGGTFFRKFDKAELLIRRYGNFFLKKALLRYVVDEDYTLLRSRADPKNLVFVRAPRGDPSPRARGQATSSAIAPRASSRPTRTGPAEVMSSVPPSQSKPTRSAGPKQIDPAAIAQSPCRSDATPFVSRISGPGPSRLPARPPRPMADPRFPGEPIASAPDGPAGHPPRRASPADESGPDASRRPRGLGAARGSRRPRRL